jgi:hypothetical protein
METPEHTELEKFIDQQLKKLPEREAPDDLIANVFATIAARQNAPWYKQPFTSWPRNTQALLFAALAVMFAGAVYLASRPAEALSAGALTERATSFAWIARMFETLSSTAVGVVRGLPWQWLVALSVVLFAMYAACVATGFALYKITARQNANAAA